MTRIYEIVREQVKAEWPDRASEDIDDRINAMSNVELLERISDAIRQHCATRP